MGDLPEKMKFGNPYHYHQLIKTKKSYKLLQFRSIALRERAVDIPRNWR
jgi:hypothetical protein